MPAAWRRPSGEAQAGLRARDMLCWAGCRHGCEISAQGRFRRALRSATAQQCEELSVGSRDTRHPGQGQGPRAGQCRERQQGQRSPAWCFTSSSPQPRRLPHCRHRSQRQAGHGRNSAYLRALLPRGPVPSGRPGPQSESRPGPVHEKEKERLRSASMWALKPGQPHCRGI